MRTILTISCALGALVAAQPALAQDANTTGSTEAAEAQGNDIVVTARRQSERLQDVPIAITAVSGRELDSRGLSNVTEIAQITPNLQFTPGQGGNSGGIAPFIRGVGENDFIITADPAVGVYIDGVYVARTFGATTELLGIDRIEVLRGPQGTLFGKNTVGGAISVVSSIPGQNRRVEADVRYGSFDDVRVRLLAETPVSDTLSIGVSGFGEWGDGWQKVPSGKNLSNRNVIAGKLALHYDAAPFDAVLLVDGLHRNQNSAAHSMLAFTPTFFSTLQSTFLTPCCTPNPAIDRTDTTPYFNVDKTDAINASLTLSYDLGAATLKSISAYRRVEALFGRDGDASASINYAGDRHDETARQLSQELQLSFDLGGRGSILVGAFAYQEKTRDLTRLIVADGLYPALVAAVGDTLYGIPTFVLDLNLDFDNRQTTTNYAVFTNANYKLTDALTFEVGARYTWEKKRFTQAAKRIYSNLPLLAGTPEYTLEKTWDAFTPRASISYDIRPGLKTYASFSRGFRSGGFNGRPTSLEEIGSYDPEFLTAYEAGIKADFGRYVTVNVAAFRNEYRDQQVLVNTVSQATGVIISRNENAGRSRIQGLEVEAVARVTPRFTLSGSLGLLDAKYLEYTSVIGGTETDVSFRKPKQAPEITASGSMVYRAPLSDALDGVFRVDAAYRSKTFIDVENSPLLVAPDHAIVNASAEFAHLDSGVSLRFAVDNLTNKQVLRAGFDGSAAFGFVEGYFTDPRRYWVTLRIAR